MMQIAKKLLVMLVVARLLLLDVALVSASEKKKPDDIPDIKIVSIVPGQAEAGSKVTVIADGLDEEVTVQLGGEPLAIRMPDKRRIEFVVPHGVEAGQHILTIKRGTNGGRSYLFPVQESKPIVTLLSPDTVTRCEARSNIVVQGQGFRKNTQLLLNGSMVKSSFQGNTSMSMELPSGLAKGLYQVVAKNGDATSTPVALSVITAPELYAVTVGGESVNSYELLLEGKNFQQNSYILVNGVQIGGASGIHREYLSYKSCTGIVYHRYPYSSDVKPLTIQVFNGNGESSAAVSITAP